MPPKVEQTRPPIRSRATAPTTTTSPTGSILDRAVDVSTVGGGHKKVCLYGGNGRGKTSLMCQFPKPLLLVSFEPNRSGGANSVVNVPGVKVLRYGTQAEVDRGDAEFTSVRQAVEMAEYLRDNDAGGYATVGVDGGSSLQRRVLEELMREQGKHLPESATFGTVPDGMYPIRSDRTKAALVPFLDIPCHVVVTAKEKDHNPPKEYNEKGKLVVDMRPKQVRGMSAGSWFAPELSGSNVSWLIDACGYTFRMYSAPEVTRVPNPLNPNDPNDVTEVPTGRYEIRVFLKQHDNYAGRGQFPDPTKVPESVGGTPSQLYSQLAPLMGL